MLARLKDYIYNHTLQTIATPLQPAFLSDIAMWFHVIQTKTLLIKKYLINIMEVTEGTTLGRVIITFLTCKAAASTNHNLTDSQTDL